MYRGLKVRGEEKEKRWEHQGGGRQETSDVVRDEGRKLNVDRALNLSLIMCGLLNQQSP